MSRHTTLWPCLPLLVFALAVWPSLRADEIAGISASRVLQIKRLDRDAAPPVVSCVALHPDGKLLAAAGDDHVVQVWSVETGKVVQRLAEHADWVRTIAYSPDGSTLATSGNDHRIIFWDAHTGEMKRVFARHHKAVTEIVYSHDGSKLAAIGFEECAHVYDAQTGETLYDLDCPCRDMRAVAFSPDDTMLAIGGRIGAIRLWNVRNGEHVRDIPAHRQRIRAIAFAPDGTNIISAGDDRAIVVSAIDGSVGPFRLSRSPAKVMAIALVAPNRLATAGSDNRIRIWNLDQGREIEVLDGHTGSITTLAAQGDLLVSGSFDTTIRVWELSNNVAGGETTPRRRVGSTHLNLNPRLER